MNQGSAMGREFTRSAVSVRGQFNLKHDYGGLVSDFASRIEEAGAMHGLHFIVLNDFHTLVDFWDDVRKSKYGNPLTPNFDPRFGYDGKDGFWVAACNADGDIVGISVGRLYDWTRTDLGTEFKSLRFSTATVLRVTRRRRSVVSLRLRQLPA
jgi:hypothetical protein